MRVLIICVRVSESIRLTFSNDLLFVYYVRVELDVVIAMIENHFQLLCSAKCSATR